MHRAVRSRPARMRECDKDGMAIQINGQRWAYRAKAGEFRRVCSKKKSRTVEM